jgi:MFS family permease
MDKSEPPLHLVDVDVRSSVTSRYDRRGVQPTRCSTARRRPRGRMSDNPDNTVEVGAGARWFILAISLFVTATSFLFINGIAFVIPALTAQRGVSLADASVLSSMPSLGMVVTLIIWGYVLDHVGERIVLTAGSALTAIAVYAATSAHSLVWMGFYLFLGGMATAGCNTAGGRLISAWFSPQQRGLVMGIRQTAQPLGIALGALVIPSLAGHGTNLALIFIAMVCALAAMASFVGIIDPPRKPRTTAAAQELANPYRGSFVLWRIHAVAGLLMIPQAITATFMLIWLTERHHWSFAAAGGLVTITQILGAVGRIAVGRWSDRIGSRMQPVRILAVAAASTLFLLALCDSTGLGLDVPFMVAVSVIALLDNGLEATAITEFAGSFWTGRALGIQNTTQRVMASAVPSLFGAVIGATEYPVGWAICGLFPLVAMPFVPTPARSVAPRTGAERHHTTVWRVPMRRKFYEAHRPKRPRCDH